MSKTFIYAGSFDPPHYGHLDIVNTFMKDYGHPLIIVCAINPNKNSNWFTTKESKEMWLTYDLPAGVIVETIEEFDSRLFDKGEIVLVRGLRNESDANYEKQVMVEGNKDYGITQFIHIYGNGQYEHTSSSYIKEKAFNYEFKNMYLDVSYGVISKLWQYILRAKVYMAVGRPGSGKTTILNELVKDHDSYNYINTDHYNQALKPKLRRYFETDDLFEIAKTRESELVAVISDSWLEMLFNDLKNDKGNNIIIVEIAYGLQESKKLYKYLGANIINFYCSDNIGRNRGRNTEHLEYFIDKIPDKVQTREICMREHLNLIEICTDNKNAKGDNVVNCKMRPELVDELVYKIRGRK